MQSAVTENGVILSKRSASKDLRISFCIAEK